ncbi:alkaline phosphatase family protein [Thiorhodococcus mannitoliphagus]|uniref:Alkaline phosphatase family protein n=1 Tax=Thiorhodococcus mannitoliphagus TaxID=329406 RepID=A0A6P1DT09_9GAMM|nr:alkaline phosphatase family protein [Thiorhodococcus mannitoliphagus]NEX21248.1 alkaline phosphatase family protein [Thiorhodococcus mannitoliphagus]
MQSTKPDYQGGGIVNLMSSIIQGRGGRSDHPPLSLLPPHELAGATHVILLVIDGLGADWLARHGPETLLSCSLRGAITSVFPPTTAAAITTYLTGAAPLEHGLTGWFTYLRELGCVMTVLPGEPRYGGVSYRRAGIDPKSLFPAASVFARISARGFAVSPAFIANSDFNRVHTRGAEILTFETLDQAFRQCLRVLRPGPRWSLGNKPQGPSYTYVYWPRLDSIGHELGIESDAARAHLLEIDQAIHDFILAAKGTDTLLLVCADHGQLDTLPTDVIDIDEHPRLAQTLLLPICGEPRAGFCYLKADARADFESYCEHELRGLVDLIPSRQLVEDGYFGEGIAHPHFMDRVGDFCMLPRGSRVLNERLPSEPPYRQIGVHGGLSSLELMVPLSVLTA